MKKHVKLDGDYYLISQEVNSNLTIEVAKTINHIIVIDVSGSMYYDLPEIRKNLKNKISNLVKQDSDTISIIWFSGRNDAGILKEEVHVNSLKQLNDLNDAIDRFLKPIGLTAFAKPLELVDDVIERISKTNPNSVFSLIFMSDGYNNDVPWNDVISAVNKISPKLSSSVVVEYGWYADSKKLSEIAGVLGGEKISCSGFEEYDVVVGKTLNKTLSGGKKIVVEINDNYLHDFAFSITQDGSILVYNIANNKIMIGSDVNTIYYFSRNAIGGETHPHYPENELLDTALYGAIYVLSDKFQNEDAEKVFYALGDNYHYRILTNAFGKQKLNEFKSAIKECVVDASKRFPDGIDIIKPVADDAYCLMNLIEDLNNMDDIMFYPTHPEFQYKRIGRKRIVKGSQLSDVDKKRLNEAKNVDEAQKILEELKDKKVDVKFVTTNPNKGYSLRDLVWNEERANLSVRVRYDGKVELPENKFDITEVLSFKYNTYTIIKDGIVNLQTLPVNRTPEIEKLLIDSGVNWGNYNAKDDFDNTILIDLTSIPVINRKMVTSISAKELAKLEWELKKLQGDKKVYDHYRKILFPKTSKSYVEMLGQECADWLKDIGITDFNGFAPKTDAAEAKDFYMSVNLATKIKGLSALPKVDDVYKKLNEGKVLKISESVMSDAVKKYHEQLQSDMFKTLNEQQQKGVLESYLNTKSSILNKQKRNVMQKIAEIKFALILSKKWFKEFQSFDENVLKLTLDGQEVQFTFDLSEKEVKV